MTVYIVKQGSQRPESIERKNKLQANCNLIVVHGRKNPNLSVFTTLAIASEQRQSGPSQSWKLVIKYN